MIVWEKHKSMTVGIDLRLLRTQYGRVIVDSVIKLLLNIRVFKYKLYQML